MQLFWSLKTTKIIAQTFFHNSRSKQNLAKKLNLTLKPSNLKEKTYLAHFYAPKSKCPRRFLRDRPWNCAHVPYVPIPRPDTSFFFFFLFAEESWAKVVHICRKILTDKESDKKKKKKTSGKIFARTHGRRAKFHGLNRKNGEDIRRVIHLGFLQEPACTRI